MVNSTRLEKYFIEYKECHQNKVNLMIHKIAIPLIFFHIVAMLNWIPVFNINGFVITCSMIISIPVVLFYFSLQPIFASIMLLFVVFCHICATFTPTSVVWLIAIFAWFVQLLGHAKWEKKSPAFTKNFIQVLIGPLYMLNLILARQFPTKY